MISQATQALQVEWDRQRVNMAFISGIHPMVTNLEAQVANLTNENNRLASSVAALTAENRRLHAQHGSGANLGACPDERSVCLCVCVCALGAM